MISALCLAALQAVLVPSAACGAAQDRQACAAQAASSPPRTTAELLDALDERTRARILQHGPLGPPEPDATNAHERSDAAAELGQRLFFDRRLSLDGSRSCASCHDPALFFADGRALPEHLGRTGRHTLSVVNAAYQRWILWDGGVDSLWSQVFDPLEDPRELGLGAAGLARLLAEDETLARGFRTAFGRAPGTAGDEAERTAVLGAKAIAAYEARLVSRESAFDRFARALEAGDRAAAERYPADALRGLLLFVGKADCRSCHAGPLFSDGEFHAIGVPSPAGGRPTDPLRKSGLERVRASPRNAAGPFSDTPDGARAQELARLAGGAHLWGAARTPTLRNASRTAPYMHLGQLATLADVLRFYSTLEGAIPSGHHGERVLTPLRLTTPELADLEAFLRSLDGEPIPEPLGRAPNP
jgi:cytochrome c peroxidase